MALLTISGEPASRWEEVAHGAAQLLGFDLVTESRLAQWISEEFGDTALPPRAWPQAAVSVLARLAREHHLVVAVSGAEELFSSLPLVLRASISAPQAQRVGNLMIDQRLDRDQAAAALRNIDAAHKRERLARFGRRS